MKFKVGDKVKLIRRATTSWEFELGEVCDIVNINGELIYIQNGNRVGFIDFSEKGCLELITEKYTFEDFRKAPIGTKVTFKKGELIVKTAENRLENDFILRENIELKNFEDNYESYGKIIKIEEPIEYKTVYEAKQEIQEILDEKEREYLSNIIRPFRSNVKYISKQKDGVNKKCYIQIALIDEEVILLPYFKNETMYKSMENNRKYSLKELGL